MRSVIFGGSGFIGGHLRQALLAEGHNVTIADIVPPDGSQDAGVSFVYCDVRRPITITVSESFDRVYNLAAVHRTPGHAPGEYYETNVLGAYHITHWADVNKVPQIVFTSSISVYGPSEDAKDEASIPLPNSDYGRSKLIAESIHQQWASADHGRRLLIVRPAVVFGPREHGNFTRLAAALSKGVFLYAGRQDVVKSCIFVADLVESISFMAKSDESNVTYNCCYPQRYTIGDICRAFHEVAGYRLPRTFPATLVKAAVHALAVVNPNEKGSLSSARVRKLTASTNIVPQVLLDRDFSWPHELRSALQIWSAADPAEQFV